MPTLLWCVCTLGALTRRECRSAFQKFSEECDSLSALDRAMARLRYVPYYKRECSYYEFDWDELEALCFVEARSLVAGTVAAVE
jgi:hypothetical protein